MDPDIEAERRVWTLLTRDFHGQLPAELNVQAHLSSGTPAAPAKFQLFEVIVPAIFTKICPGYEWSVTPNQSDGGVDFIGRRTFLRNKALGIDAVITIGGQCKKRSHVGNIIEEVAGSLVNMARTLNPTFFVVALSARLDRDRVDAAQLSLEQTLRRHCHILDRTQIEGLIHDHLGVLTSILRLPPLSEDEVRDVHRYFSTYRDVLDSDAVSVKTPDNVLAGVPFVVGLTIRSPVIASSPTSHLWWTSRPDQPVTLIGPIGADESSGIELQSDSEDPVYSHHSIELVTYSVGLADIGEVQIGFSGTGSETSSRRIPLGHVLVVDNVRPRFFERPFRTGLEQLTHEYERALVKGVASVSIAGSGGSGKSRLCEEFSLERRRRGGHLVSAKQPKTLDDPHRLLADLFVGLIEDDLVSGDPADRIVHAIQKLDPVLADKAGPAIRSIFGDSTGRSDSFADQSLLSSLLMLIVARGCRAPLIVHLQDLHWSSASVLLLLERLVWQLEHALSGPQAPTRRPESGILFVFEGRVRERQSLDADGWSSEPFEAFLEKLDCVVITCSPFGPADGYEFIRRLFEEEHSTHNLVSGDLLELQHQLIERIYESAGGNPFHSLQQVQYLKERRVLGQNPYTGLLYLIQPESGGTLLPDSVFESIQHRWQYLKLRTPKLALLVWAAALIEDRIPTLLFRRLWREIAPDASLEDVDATGMIWTGNGEEREVAFRHENYFRSIRRFEVSSIERRRVVNVYSSWFSEMAGHDPSAQFRWARILLELPDPDIVRAQTLLTTALRGASRHHDARLAQRISAALLDLTWDEDAAAPITTRRFTRNCDDDLTLTRELLGSDRSQAAARLESVRERLEKRLSNGRRQSLQVSVELQRLKWTAEVLREQVLLNDRHPATASRVGGRAVSGVKAVRRSHPSTQRGEWEVLEMEALHSYAVALALSGEIDRALSTSEQAVVIARRSTSPLAQNVLSTYANILLSRDPNAAEGILRQCLSDLARTSGRSDAVDAAQINLSMALVLRATSFLPEDTHQARVLLDEAHELLFHVYNGTFQLGNYPDAGAAALMLGIVSALRGDGDEGSWFAQGVAAAARGRQMETLWRSHINLATAMYRKREKVDESIRDHARAALEIMEDTLSPYAEPDRSPRFELIRVPLAHAVRFLILAGDDNGRSALVRYPTLRATFQDARAGIIREDRGGHMSHEWLSFGSEDYVLY